jgi:hypothetical protein
MNQPPPVDDAQFLRDLVKSSRQRTIHLKWTDRDGTDRLTVLTANEATRLETIARERRISKSEVLRQAAHIPVQPAPPGTSRNT